MTQGGASKQFFDPRRKQDPCVLPACVPSRRYTDGIGLGSGLRALTDDIEPIVLQSAVAWSKRRVAGHCPPAGSATAENPGVRAQKCRRDDWPATLHRAESDDITTSSGLGERS